MFNEYAPKNINKPNEKPESPNDLIERSYTLLRRNKINEDTVQEIRLAQIIAQSDSESYKEILTDLIRDCIGFIKEINTILRQIKPSHLEQVKKYRDDADLKLMWVTDIVEELACQAWQDENNQNTDTNKAS